MAAEPLARTRWTGLRSLEPTRGGPKDAKGTVRFEPRMATDGRMEVLRENSLFSRIKGRWL